MDGEVPPRWYEDRWFWGALALGATLRVLPMLIFGWTHEDVGCTRDECIFRQVAKPILQGKGLGPSARGWLPAPGMPYLMAASAMVTGKLEAVKWLHVLLTLPMLAGFYATAQRIAGTSAARWTAGLLAIHPTLVFYAGTQWAETLYVTLLSGLVWSTLWAREGNVRRALLPGVLLGLTVLVRGVATYLAPLVLLALWWPTGEASGHRKTPSQISKRAAAFAVGLLVTLGPYSLHASSRWGGLVISDATLGHVMALGNDDYPPVTFDYGNGQLTGRVYANTLSRGRRDCPRLQDPVAHDRCEVNRSLRWIRRNPATFVSRIPERLAQNFNPHSFLTRHLRWHGWHALPWALEEALVAFQALFTTMVVLGGTFGMWARAKGAAGVLTVGIVGYHLAVVAALYGLTRFRLPLEPLWILWLAAVLSAPRQSVALWRQSPARAVGAAVTLPVLVVLLAHYAWTGWPGLDVLL